MLDPGVVVKAPPLPRSIEWSRAARKEWAAWWASAVAQAWSASDVGGLLMLLRLVDDFHRAESPSARVALLREIRLQSEMYGLTPRSRFALGWEVARAERMVERREREREADAIDPRARLRAVPPPEPPEGAA